MVINKMMLVFVLVVLSGQISGEWKRKPTTVCWRRSMRRKWCLIRTRVHAMREITCLQLNKCLPSVWHQDILKHCFSLKSMGEKLFSHESEELSTIVQFLYKTYKGEGARKLHKRIFICWIARNKLLKSRTSNIAGIAPSLELNYLSNQLPPILQTAATKSTWYASRKILRWEMEKYKSWGSLIQAKSTCNFVFRHGKYLIY